MIGKPQSDESNTMEEKTGNNFSIQDSQAADRFFQLLMANQSRIFRYIIKLVPLWNDADDLFQETTRVMWKKFGDFETGTDFVAWGIQIARYQILNYRKKQSQRGNTVVFNDELLRLVELEAQERESTSDARMMALEACIRKLPDRQRRLIMMRYQPGMTVKRLSERVGMKLFTLYKAVARIQDGLLHCIRRKLAEEGLE